MFKFYLKNCFRYHTPFSVGQSLKTSKHLNGEPKFSLFYNGTLVHCWWDYKMVKPLWKTVLEFLKKVCKEPGRGIAAASYSSVAPDPSQYLWCQGHCEGWQTVGTEPLLSWGLKLFWSPSLPHLKTWVVDWPQIKAQQMYPNLPFPDQQWLIPGIFQAWQSCKVYYNER